MDTGESVVGQRQAKRLQRLKISIFHFSASMNMNFSTIFSYQQVTWVIERRHWVILIALGLRFKKVSETVQCASSVTGSDGRFCGRSARYDKGAGEKDGREEGLAERREGKHLLGWLWVAAASNKALHLSTCGRHSDATPAQPRPLATSLRATENSK